MTNISLFEHQRPADYLMRLARSAVGQAYKSLAVSELAIRPGDVVLDLGCGPGADLAAFAGAAGAGGRVIGLDTDPAALAEAAARTADLPQVKVAGCDIHALGLPGASVDRAHTDRVLQHVADPAAVLREAGRVLRPGGIAVFAEPDWDTLVIDYPDLPVARAYTRFVADRVVRNACIGRQLPRLAGAAGLRVRDVIPVTTVFRDAGEADRVLGFQRVTRRAVDAGRLSAAAAAAAWLAHFAEQPFFASVTLYLVSAEASGQAGS